MKEELTLQVLEENRSKEVKAVWISFITLSISSLIAVVSLPSYSKVIFIGVLILGIVTIVMAYLTPKNKNYKGNLILRKDLIIIDILSQKSEHPIAELSYLNIVYSGYNGRLNAINVSPDNGSNNFISFEHKGQSNRYEVLIQENHLRLLNKLILNWRTINNRVTLRNIYGRKIETIR